MTNYIIKKDLLIPTRLLNKFIVFQCANRHTDVCTLYLYKYKTVADAMIGLSLA